MICELAGIMMSVVPKAFTSVTAADCAITVNPTFAAAPSLLSPALIGPENVVVAIISSCIALRHTISIPSA